MKFFSKIWLLLFAGYAAGTWGTEYFAGSALQFSLKKGILLIAVPTFQSLILLLMISAVRNGLGKVLRRLGCSWILWALLILDFSFLWLVWSEDTTARMAAYFPVAVGIGAGAPSIRLSLLEHRLAFALPGLLFLLAFLETALVNSLAIRAVLMTLLVLALVFLGKEVAKGLRTLLQLTGVFLLPAILVLLLAAWSPSSLNPWYEKLASGFFLLSTTPLVLALSTKRLD
ncbi:MAG: hypothetical protein HY645_14315 [Acidobacteria bacterium]|nr:hypothetical protein [Acidobacteriota bacterium]